MANYPVKNGAGQDIVTGYDVDADPFVPRGPAGDYPVKNGAGGTIIASAPALTKTWPTRPDGARVVSRYPVKDGLGQGIVLSAGGGVAPPDLHFLGDSMLDGGLLVAQVAANLAVARETTQDGVGGSTLIQQATRWAATPQHWAKALISVDAMGPGDGSVTTIDDILSKLTSGKFLYIEGPIHQDTKVGTPGRTTTDAQLDGIRAKYASAYVDAFDTVRWYSTGTPEDLSDIGYGIWPRTFRADGIHPNVTGRALFGQIIAAAIIARGWDGSRSVVCARAPVIARDGANLAAFEGIWFQYPATASTYQWFRNGSPMAGQTGATCPVSATTPDDEVHCVVTRGGVSVSSNVLIVNPTPETGYSAATNTLINAMDRRPTTGQKATINAAMARVQALAAKLDWFSAPLHNEQASRINWLDPSRIASPIGNPAFAAGRGWTFDVAVNSYLDTNWIPATAGGKWGLNSAHVGVDIVTTDTSNTSGVVFGSGLLLLFRPRQYTTTSLVRLNGATSSSIPAGGAVGHQVASAAPSTMRVVKNGTALGSAAFAPTALSALPVMIGTNEPHRGVIGGWHFGSDLTDADCAELASILADLRAAFTP